MNVHPKVAAAGAAGALVTIIVIVAAQFGVTIDSTVAAALVTLITFAAGYLKSAPAA